MGEVVISPSGPGAIEAGLMIDETGTRFCVVTFRETGADPVIVTFEVPIFQQFAAHMSRLSEAAKDEANWAVGSR